MGLEMSAPDSERFGLGVARATLVGGCDVDALGEDARRLGATLLIARAALAERDSLAALEARAGTPLDVLVHMETQLDAPHPALAAVPGQGEWREAGRGDSGAVADLARLAFADYCGHYHTDPRLPRDRCDEVYASWARACCLDRQRADSVLLLVAGDGGTLGFCALRLVDPLTCEFGLSSIAPGARGRGHYRSLVALGLDWARARGARRWRSSTQLGNTRVMAAWQRYGFRETLREATFHWWLD